MFLTYFHTLLYAKWTLTSKKIAKYSLKSPNWSKLLFWNVAMLLVISTSCLKDFDSTTGAGSFPSVFRHNSRNFTQLTLKFEMTCCSPVAFEMGCKPRLATVCEILRFYRCHLYLRPAPEFSQCFLKFTPKVLSFESENEQPEYWGSYVTTVQNHVAATTFTMWIIHQTRLMQKSMANFGKCDSWCAVTVRNLKYERPSGGNASKCPISRTGAECDVPWLCFCISILLRISVIKKWQNICLNTQQLKFHCKLHFPCKKMRSDS